MVDEADAPGPDSPGSALVGTVLAGRYRIVRHLGEGAMGSVYLGEHLRFGRMDAIKVLRPGMARDREATERFQRGARNASAINHPHVCTVYDFSDTDDGHQFLAMEFVDGTTLADVLETEGSLPLERSVEIVRQIASALDAAHDLGIVHRDLKPGNVMLARGRDGGDLVKVVDFDIAKGTSEGEGAEVTRTGFVVGTPEYMSPEQLIGDPLDGRSDTYSLALVFVRILTGLLPVRASSTQDLMVERLTQEPLALADIAPDLVVPALVQTALDHGLQRRREDRPDTAGAFAEGLTRALSGQPASARVAVKPPGPPATPSDAGGVPATQVGVGPGPVRPPAAARGGTAKRWATWLAGGTLVTAVATGIALMSGDPASPPAPADDLSMPQLPQGGVTTTTDPGVQDDPPSIQPDRTGDPRGTVVDPPPAEPPVADPRQVDPPQVDPPASNVPTYSAAEVEDVLFRQLTRLTEQSGAPTFRVVEDSARWAWDQDGMPSNVRALAAYLAASALDGSGRTNDALAWARRAVELAPTNRGFQTLLTKLGGRP